MATPQQVAELTAKLTAYVGKAYGGTGETAWKVAFDATDADSDGQISADELATLLEHADVGNFFTRGAWVNGVMAALDKDASDGISFAELSSVLAKRLAPTPATSSPTPAKKSGEPLGAAVFERLNNAIVALDFAQFRTPDTAAAKAAANLAQRWAVFWMSGARALYPEPLLAQRYKEFLLDYAHAWVIAPKSVRAQVPDPRRIDFELADLVRDSVSAYVQALQAEGTAFADAYQETKRATLGLGLLVIVGLLAYGFASRGRS